MTARSTRSAIGSAGALNFTEQDVFAFALCTTNTSIEVRVTRVDELGPQTGGGPGSASGFTTTTATCPTDRRVSGGGYIADKTFTNTAGTTFTGAQPQQGVHPRGSYPSGTGELEVPDGTVNPQSWSDHPGRRPEHPRNPGARLRPVHPKSGHPDADPNSDPNSDSDSDPESNADADPEPEPNTDGDSDSDSDTDNHADADADGNAHPDAVARCDGHDDQARGVPEPRVRVPPGDPHCRRGSR